VLTKLESFNGLCMVSEILVDDAEIPNMFDLGNLRRGPRSASADWMFAMKRRRFVPSLTSSFSASSPKMPRAS
jgi:hypothetical protein